MEALDLHRDGTGGTGFRLDQIPSEVVANFFRYLPTLDMGRMMVVCRGFNEILSTNPSLWRIVHLDERTPNESAFKIIETFATRSRNTLVAIRSPESLDMDLQQQLLPLLESNRATLRTVDLELDTTVGKDNPHPIRFFHSFPNIERLNLTWDEPPEDEEHIPGVLTMFAHLDFDSKMPWSREDLEKISSVRRLYIQDGGGIHELETFSQILQACSPNLLHLFIGSVDNPEPLDFDLPVLSSLELGDHGTFKGLFTRPPPSLKHISGTPKSLDSLNPIISQNMQSFDFVIKNDYFLRLDYWLENLECMTRMIKESNSTLVKIKLKTGGLKKPLSIDVDPFLQTLKVDYLLSLPACPLLSSLYISKEQQYSSSLLAEVMVSRNFASKGWKFLGEHGDEEERSCCSLTLYLDASHFDDFRAAEQELLSRCPELVRDRAGRTEVREWDGK